MDAGQIAVMPTAGGNAHASAQPVAGTIAGKASLIGLFGGMLGQNLLGMQGTVSQQSAGQSETAPSTAKDIVTALKSQLIEQDNSTSEPDVAVANQLAAYAQLVVFQTNPSIPQQQTATTVMDEAGSGTVTDATAVHAELPITDSNAVVLSAVVGGAQEEQAIALAVAGVPKLAAGTQNSDEQVAALSERSTLKGSVESQGTDKSVQAEVKTAVEVQLSAKSVAVPQGALSRPQVGGSGTSAPLDTSSERSLQLDASVKAESASLVVKNQDNSQAVMQKATEVQTAPQEVAGNSKTAVTVVQQPVRFAQQSDVVVAASGSEGQKNATSDQQGQGTQLMAKRPETVFVQGEVVKSELVEVVPSSRMPDQHGVALHMGQQAVDATNGVVAESVKSVPQELIARQVVDRLASHEIKQGSDQISIKLSPENLGNLQLNMRMDDNRLKLDIVAENRGVRDALLQQADELKETLARQNIKVDSFNVTTSNGNQSQQQSSDWRQMTQEQRQYQPQYASLRAKSSTVGDCETPVKYFVPQYQSTIDVRF